MFLTCAWKILHEYSCYCSCNLLQSQFPALGAYFQFGPICQYGSTFCRTFPRRLPRGLKRSQGAKTRAPPPSPWNVKQTLSRHRVRVPRAPVAAKSRSRSKAFQEVSTTAYDTGMVLTCSYLQIGLLHTAGCIDRSKIYFISLFYIYRW